MREKITKNRNIILVILGVLIIALFNIGMRYLATRPRYKTLPEVRIIDKKEESTKSYAVMVQNGDSYEEYTNEDGTWPSEEEGYAFKEAKCIDNNGALVNNAVTFADGKVTLKTNKTIYCTLYFDKKVEPLEITNVEVDNSIGYQVKFTVTTKGGSGKYTYLVENYCDYGTGDSCSSELGRVIITYNENIITIDALSHCLRHSFNIKVTDINGNTAEYKVSNIKVSASGGLGSPCP